MIVMKEFYFLLLYEWIIIQFKSNKELELTELQMKKKRQKVDTNVHSSFEINKLKG